MPFDIDAARSALQDIRYDAAGLRERIHELATPRLTGSDGAEEVEGVLRDAFEELGYDVRELPFSFSTWPGRFGLVVSGVALLGAGIGAPLALRADAPLVALLVLVVGLGLALLPLLTLPVALRRLPWGRVETANLLFTRDGGDATAPAKGPSWIVMAHRDTKSQLVPTLVRTAALGLGGAGWLALVALTGLWFAGDLFRFPVVVLGAGAVVALAGLALALSWAGNGSPGAVDNGAGLAALLALADDAPDDVGFLVTDGEELGLAGARHAVDALPAVQGIINVDGLDDRGPILVAEGHGLRRRGSAPQLAAALLTAGRALEIEARRQPLPRTIPVDHQPLAAAGIPALTVLRGRWSTLLRVHRPGDSADRLDGQGAAEAATVLAGALRLLVGSRGDLAGQGGLGS
jgi:hypothetical protein